MGLTIEMHNPQEQLLRELAYPGMTQASIAITYAFIIAQEGKIADWPRLNAAIRAKWTGKSALERIKTQAWKHVEYWQRSDSNN